MYKNYIKSLGISLLTIFLFSFPQAHAEPTVFTAVGVEKYAGGPNDSYYFSSPLSVTTDSSGNIYFADYITSSVIKIDAGGKRSIVAGNGLSGFSGDGGLSTSAQLDTPMGVSIDNAGNLYIADTLNHRIRKVDTNGFISTVAGDGVAGFYGDGSLATSASLYSPHSVAVASDGSLYIADTNNWRIRKVDTSGIITTVAGSSTSCVALMATDCALLSPMKVELDGSGNFYIAEYWGNRVQYVDGSGTITTVAGDRFSAEGYDGDGGQAVLAKLSHAWDIALSSTGELYIADSGNNRVRKVDSSGVITTVAGDGVAGYSGDGGAAINAQVIPRSIAFGAEGHLYIGETSNDRIRVVDDSGNISSLAVVQESYSGFGGDEGPSDKGQLNYPVTAAFDSTGNLYFTDKYNHRIRKVDITGKITTFAGNGLPGYDGDGGPALEAQIGYPFGVAVAPDDTIYFTDRQFNRIRHIDANGIITTIAGTGVAGYSGDGGLAASARINRPFGIAIDGNGVIYFADSKNHVIRRIDNTGIITTIAGTGVAGYEGDGFQAQSAALNVPTGVEVDSSGNNIYIADYLNHRIRHVNNLGFIETIAGDGIAGYGGDGSVATLAQLRYPADIHLASTGELYVADYGNHVVRKVATNQTITTVAGTGSPGFSGDGADPLSAQFDHISDVFVKNNNIFVVDSGNDRIRIINQVYPSGTPSIPEISISLYDPVMARLNWDISNELFEGLWVELSEDRGSSFQPLTVTTKGVGELMNGPLTLGQSYIYRVRSYLGGQYSAWTTLIPITATNNPPILSGSPATQLVAGEIYSFLPTADAGELSDSVSFSITGKPAWAQFDSTTGLLSGTPELADVGNYGPITLTATDNYDASVSLDSFIIEVLTPNNPPTLSGTPDTQVVAGEIYSFLPTSDAGEPTDSVSFSIVRKPEWAQFDTTSGLLSGTPGLGDVANYGPITITATDNYNASVSLDSFTIEVLMPDTTPESTKSVEDGGGGGISLLWILMMLFIAFLGEGNRRWCLYRWLRRSENYHVST